MTLARPIFRPLALLLAAALLAAGPAACKKKENRPKRERSGKLPPAEIWKEFSGENALAHTAAQVDAGPRPSGSPALERVRVYIEGYLRDQGWEVERQTFTDPTPAGPIEFVNLIARFRGAPASSQQVILGSHYDTKRYDAFPFVGANDAGSSTGALMEIARVLAKDPGLAWRTELVFFDGEECIERYGPSDGLHGSKHYAASLVSSGRVKQYKFGILLDMVGERDLGITLPNDSPRDLMRHVFASAEALGHRDKFSIHAQSVLDDHVPVNQAGIPMINLIDFDFPHWHTEGDTMDKLDARSFAIVGSVTLHMLRAVYPR